MKFPVERKRVLEQLAWETFVVGAYAGTSDERTSILRTLATLVESEVARGDTRQNDGNSARALLPRLINATQSVRTAYTDEGFKLGEVLLAKLASDTPPSKALAETVLGALLSVRVEDTWSEGDQFHFGVGVVRPDSGRGRWVVDSCERLWAIAGDSSRPRSSRLIALRLLEHHHQTLNYTDLHSKRQDGDAPDWSFLLRAHLERTRLLASEGAHDMPLWLALRSIWEWHAAYDENPDLKGIALEAEAAFRADPVRGVFASLLIDDDVTGAAINAAASQLRSHSADEIAKFFDSGCEFLAADEEHAWRKRKLEAVAWVVAESRPLTEGMREYMSRAFSSKSIDKLPFATEMLTSYVQQHRAVGNDAELVRELKAALGEAADDENLRQILLGVYVNTRISAIRSIRPSECDLIVEHLALFDADTTLLLLGRAFAVDAAKARAAAEPMFDEIAGATPFKLKHAMLQFCFGFNAFTIGAKAPFFAQADYDWLLDQIARLPNPVPFSQLGDMDDVVELYAKFDIPWLVALIFKRIERLRPLMSHERDVFKREEAVWVLTDDFPFADIVAPLADGQPVRAEDRVAIDQLLELRSASQAVSHYLPALLAALDPSGVCVPDLVCKRISEISNPSWRDLATWADFASAYFFNSAPWRCIAVQVCAIANGFNEEDAAGAYGRLALHREGVYNARPGTVPERFVNNVEHAKKQLADETEQVLRPFREWRVRRAESTLRREKGRIAEERGRSADE